MKREEEQYQTFEDLVVYQVARKFRKAMYKLAGRLPEIEKFALADQIRRAAVSLTNNIAEGHGRFHFLEQIKFMLQARGSLEGLLDDLNACDDQKYAETREIEAVKADGWRTHKLINGYVRFLRKAKMDTPAHVRETPEDGEGDEAAQIEVAISRFNASSLERFNHSP